MDRSIDRLYYVIHTWHRNLDVFHHAFGTGMAIVNIRTVLETSTHPQESLWFEPVNNRTNLPIRPICIQADSALYGM